MGEWKKGRNAGAKRKTNKKEYNYILDTAAGTILYKFDQAASDRKLK